MEEIIDNTDVNGLNRVTVNKNHSSKRAIRTTKILEAFDSATYKLQGYMDSKDMLKVLVRELNVPDKTVASIGVYLKGSKGLLKWMMRKRLIIRHGGVGDSNTVYKRNYDIQNPFKD